MAYIRTNLSLVGTSGSMRVFTYQTTDTLATSKAANYFGTSAADVEVGDRIHLRASDGQCTLAVATKTEASNAVTVVSSATFT
jgi:hypothetical protein